MIVSSLLCLILVASIPLDAQTSFEEVSLDGVPPGAAGVFVFGDYDNDGRTDVLVAGFGSSFLALMHNEGELRVADRSEIVELEEDRSSLKGGGPIFGDYDNDGDLDLFLRLGHVLENSRDALFRNDRGRFVNVGPSVGLVDRYPTDNAIWFDYDRDGFLDLYTGHWSLEIAFAPEGVTADPPLRNRLRRNRGDGTFEDVTAAAGLDLPLHPRDMGSAHGMIAGDFDDDGWSDLYVGVWNGPNRLFRNAGDGSFTDATTAQIGEVGPAWGVAAGDIDNDGDLDIFQPSGGRREGDDETANRSLMLMNLGDAEFIDVTEGVGLDDLYGLEVTHAFLLDLDNDGDLDLLTGLPGLTLLNDGSGLMESYPLELGDQLNFPAGDLDGNGFPDILRLYANGEARPLRNLGNRNHWLQVELVGTRSNRNGVGARLLTTSGDLLQMREIAAGTGFTESELMATFGLGDHQRVDLLEIRWPSGQVDVLSDIPANRRIRVFEGSTVHREVFPSEWTHNLPDIAEAGTTIELEAVVRPWLYEATAVVEGATADLSAFGGSASIPLVPQEDGSFRLEPTSLAIEGSGGPFDFRTLSIRIEQTTSLGPYWSELSRTIPIGDRGFGGVPGGDVAVFGEALAPSWHFDPDAPTQVDFAVDTTVHDGRTALGVDSPESFFFVLVTTAPLDPDSYKSLSFAFHPGNREPEGSETFSVGLFGTGPPHFVDLLADGLVDLDRREWQQVAIPLDGIDFDPIVAIGFTGDLPPFFLADIAFLSATPQVSAVLENQTGNLPAEFELLQNFPNPFNASTVIRLTLPAPTIFDLAVYSLTGQRLATLAAGHRDAGSHAIVWDGVDEENRELASGVYLYQLRIAGGPVATRKLLLLR